MAELKVIGGKEKKKESTEIKDGSDVYKTMRFIENKDRENFYILCLNAKNFITHTELITIGTLTNSLVHPREVFRVAIKNNSASIICVHNHPSGNPAPSAEDIRFSVRLVNAGEIIGIRVLDHVVIGNDSYFSMAEKNIVGFNQQGKTGLIAQGGNEQSNSKAKELHDKLDYARNDILHELFKIEAVIKLGDAKAMQEQDNDTEDRVSWPNVFEIFSDIKDKAIEGVNTLEGLIVEFKILCEKAPERNII